jgi:hypothetical protein
MNWLKQIGLEDMIIAVAVVTVMFLAIRVLYGYWPWQQGPRKRPKIKPEPETEPVSLTLPPSDNQDTFDRKEEPSIKWAQLLIEQLPANHDGRNSWLLNHGVGEESDKLREQWEKRNDRKLPLRAVG